ncbi:MAG: hypothetical protein EPO28_12115 [Saprospiraceae bacterium]|nr:MAG: hypothetical protein EPO28_12115 [Saprospiraceae bacterium]
MTRLITKGRSFFSFSNLVLIALLAGFFAFTRSNEADQKTVSAAADKMNVFYIGVDNPITVAVEEVSSRKVSVTSKDVELIDKGKGHYIVHASKPGDAILVVSAKGMKPQDMKFRVKRLPDPLAVLDNTKSLNWFEGGNLKAEDFKESKGLNLNMGICFDYQEVANIEIAEFSIVCVSKREDPVEVFNRQANFNDRAKALVAKAAPGDTYYFENVKARMPGTTGEENLRELNSLAFKIE